MLKNVLLPETILLDVDAKDKIDLFNKITALAKELDIISDENKVIEEFYAKEQSSETYLGTDCAIPHARSNKVLKNTIFFVRVKKAIRWSDEDNAKFIFAILAKEADIDLHIDMLMAVSKKVLDNDFLNLIKVSNDKDEILNAFNK